jgi:hypothetical protein
MLYHQVRACTKPINNVCLESYLGFFLQKNERVDSWRRNGSSPRLENEATKAYLPCTWGVVPSRSIVPIHHFSRHFPHRHHTRLLRSVLLPLSTTRFVDHPSSPGNGTTKEELAGPFPCCRRPQSHQRGRDEPLGAPASRLLLQQRQPPDPLRQQRPRHLTSGHSTAIHPPARASPTTSTFSFLNTGSSPSFSELLHRYNYEIRLFLWTAA